MDPCCSTRIFDTNTCHFITRDWQLKSRILATREVTERHTGRNISQIIQDICDEFGLTSVVAITTDNASNMVACGADLGFNWIGCFAHSLQLSVNEGLKLPIISKMVTTAKKVVEHFSRSHLAGNALLDHQRRTGEARALRLEKSVDTRWNSTYLLLKRLLKLRPNVRAVLYDETITKEKDRVQLEINEDTWRVMEQILPVFEPLAEATNMLSNDNLPTLGSEYVLLKALLSTLHVDDLDSARVSDLKIKITSSLQK